MPKTYRNRRGQIVKPRRCEGRRQEPLEVPSSRVSVGMRFCREKLKVELGLTVEDTTFVFSPDELMNLSHYFIGWLSEKQEPRLTVPLGDEVFSFDREGVVEIAHAAAVSAAIVLLEARYSDFLAGWLKVDRGVLAVAFDDFRAGRDYTENDPFAAAVAA